MKIKVDEHKISIIKKPINEKEINISNCKFEFAEPITNDYVKEAYFTFNGKSYKQEIINNECSIPYEVLEKKGEVEIGVVAYLIENNEYVKRYNPSPAYFDSWIGSLKEAENTKPITPSEMEQFEQALEEGLNQVANVDIDAEETETGATVTITNRNAESKTVHVYNGTDGEQGPKGDKGEKGDTGLQGPQGPQGIQGEQGPAGKDGADGKDGQDGADATINGVNTLTIEAGSNISIDQQGSTMTISSTGGSGGTSDYTDLTNKPSINNVTLTGNKTTSDLGIVIPDELSDLSDDSTHRLVTDTEKSTWNAKSDFSGSYNDLTDKPTIPTVPTNVSAFTNDAGYLTQHQDISGKLDTSAVKTTTNTTQGNVYDVTYINTMIGDIESLLSEV